MEAAACQRDGSMPSPAPVWQARGGGLQPEADARAAVPQGDDDDSGQVHVRLELLPVAGARLL